MRPMAHGNAVMNDTRIASGALLDRYISEARAAAAAGTKSYAQALQEIAIDHGQRDWDTLQGFLREGRSYTGKNRLDHAFDVLMVTAADADPKPRTHLVDRIIRRSFGILLLPLTVVGMPKRIMAITIAAVAAACTSVTGPLAYATWHDDRSFSHENSIVMSIPISIALTLWLASRWAIHNSDPLHRACHDLRNWAAFVGFQATLFGAVPMATMSKWSNPNAAEILIGWTSLMGPALWLLAIYADAAVAERRRAA